MILSRVIYKIRYFILRSKLAYFGENARFVGDIRILNPQYVHIGANCKIGSMCRIEAWDSFNGVKFSPTIEFGNDVRINSKCHIGAINSIKIGDNCLLGSNVFITDHSHGQNKLEEMNIHPSERDLYSKGSVSIGKNSWICENVVILPGVHIGECCTVAAGSIVTKDVASYSVVAGNPAKIVKKIL
ncbi:hypothetical protein IGI68_001359 [Enterococcus sp. DIV1314a]